MTARLTATAAALALLAGIAFADPVTYTVMADNGNSGGSLVAEEQAWMGRPYSIEMIVPPLGAVVLQHQPLKKMVAPEASKTEGKDELRAQDP